MSAPLHVWQPPILASTVGKQVVLSAVVGPKDVAEPIKQQLLAHAPRDPGRATSVIDSATLRSNTEIRLVSATDDEPSDLALASAARRSGADYLLRGEVIAAAGSQPPGRNPQGSNHLLARAANESSPSLRLSWRLTSLGDGGSTGGMPVVVDLESAVDRYPELAFVGDHQQALVGAAVRETYRLMTPSVERQWVQLSIAYLLPGSRDVRRGNAAALAGRWGEADAIWSDVLQKHPAQVAAIHNLALAAAAGQDFSRAKQLARRAIRLQPSSLHQQTLVWIELMQRDYHEAFDLGDPPEGWFVTN